MGDAPSQETERFAAALVGDLGPVRRIPRLRFVGAGLLIWVLSISGIVVVHVGPRPDVRTLEVGLPYAGVLAGLVLFGLGGLLAALGGSVPGRERLSRIGMGAIALALVIWIPAAAGMLLRDTPLGPFDAAWLGTSLSCIGIATGAGLLPVIAVASFVIGAFPYRPAVAAGVGGAAMVAFGSGAVHLTCSAEEFVHVSLAHVMLPLAAGAVAGALLARLTGARLRR